MHYGYGFHHVTILHSYPTCMWIKQHCSCLQGSMHDIIVICVVIWCCFTSKDKSTVMLKVFVEEPTNGKLLGYVLYFTPRERADSVFSSKAGDASLGTDYGMRACSHQWFTTFPDPAQYPSPRPPPPFFSHPAKMCLFSKGKPVLSVLRWGGGGVGHFL